MTCRSCSPTSVSIYGMTAETVMALKRFLNVCIRYTYSLDYEMEDTISDNGERLRSHDEERLRQLLRGLKGLKPQQINAVYDKRMTIMWLNKHREEFRKVSLDEKDNIYQWILCLVEETDERLQHYSCSLKEFCSIVFDTFDDKLKLGLTEVSEKKLMTGVR